MVEDSSKVADTLVVLTALIAVAALLTSGVLAAYRSNLPPEAESNYSVAE